MTGEKALEHLKYHEYWTTYSWQDEVCEIAIKALEKQIPHALAPKESDCAEIPRCGKCGGIMDLMQGKLNYCPNCGQALDWED